MRRSWMPSPSSPGVLPQQLSTKMLCLLTCWAGTCACGLTVPLHCSIGAAAGLQAGEEQ
jgi:hypothetical protein